MTNTALGVPSFPILGAIALAAVTGTILFRAIVPRLVKEFQDAVNDPWTWETREKLRLARWMGVLLCGSVASIAFAWSDTDTGGLEPKPVLLALAPTLGGLAYFDARSRFLPDVLQGCALAVTVACFLSGVASPGPVGERLLSLAIPALLWLLMVTYEGVRGQEGLGLGDIKLLAVMALSTGPGTLVAAIVVACLGALIWRMASSARRWLRKSKGDPKDQGDRSFAFGPWLILGFVAMHIGT